MMRIFSEVVRVVAGSTELMLLVKTTLVLSLSLSAMWFTRSARASVRHLVLSCTFAVLIALPVVMVLAPSVRIEIPGSAPVEALVLPATAQEQAVGKGTNRASVDASTTVKGTNWTGNYMQTLVWLAWGVGVALFLTSFVTSLLRLRHVRRCGIPWLDANATIRDLSAQVGVGRPPDVLLHDDVAVPVTFGMFNPVVLLPTDARKWSEMDLRRVFVHELEHVRRADWFVHTFARAVSAFYWFQPLVWIAWRRICLEAERACDDAVLLRTERADYAEQLVNLARRLSRALPPPALSMANRSDLSQRVAAILDKNQARGRNGTLTTTMVLTLAATLVLAIAPMRAVSRGGARTDVVSIQKSSGKTPQQQALDRALLEASETGKAADVVQLLDAGADVNAAIEGDGSPLIVTARAGNKAIVELLLNRGANPDLGVPGDGNALIMAAREGHEDVVTLLLDRGAGVDQVVSGDENALIQASAAGELKVVKLLVSRGADVNARVWVEGLPNGEWRTPLSMARKRGSKAVVDYLISAGARE